MKILSTLIFLVCFFIDWGKGANQEWWKIAKIDENHGKINEKQLKYDIYKIN